MNPAASTGTNGESLLKGQSAVGIVLTLIAIILLSDVLIMLVLKYLFPPLSPIVELVLNELLLAVTILPAFYKLVLSPLLRQAGQRKAVQESLAATCNQLNEKKSFVESVITNSQSGLIVTDPYMNIQLANPYSLKLFHRRHADVTAGTLEDLCPEMHSAIAGGIDSAEITIRTHDGKSIIGYKRCDLKGQDGSPVGNIITFADISEITSIRNKMRRKERLATMGEVVARVAHEMRNPLCGITAVAQVLSMDLKLSNEQVELFDSLLSEARRLNNLVEELLDCSKEIKLNRQEFDLARSLNEVLAATDTFVQEKALDVVKVLPTGGILLYADPDRFKQVMINIVKNAVDASPAAGMIRIFVAELNGTVTMEVQDSGPGIPEACLEKVFDVFYTTKRNGTGLGLSISRKIVASHGGTLSAANSPDGGAIFTVTFPPNGGEDESTYY